MEDSNVKLPLEIQLWLLEQSGYFLKAKLDDRKYEAACVLFEKLLCGYNKKELKGKLQVVYSDLIQQLQKINRWEFIKAACPFVIQCCAQILSNRGTLGMVDRLSVAVTKLLLTAHWCFLEAPSECGLDPSHVVFPLKTMELFVQLLVPCAYKVREEDLSFSLSSGMLIWQPLWKHSCPEIPSFTRRVLLAQSAPMNKSHCTTNGNMRYFDIVVLRCLSSCYLSEEALSWCLIYILQHLQSELFLFCDISESWPSIRSLRHNTKMNVAPQKSVPLFVSQMTEKPYGLGLRSASVDFEDIGSPVEERKEPENSEPIYLPNEYSKFISEEGKIHHTAVLEIIYKVTRNASLKICETLLYILHLLVELGIVNKTKESSDEIVDSCYETTVNCLLDLIMMIGCDNNDSGIRGSKGQSLRILSHDIFGKLYMQDSEQMGILLTLYIRKKSTIEILNFMHSFTGFCFGKIFLSPSPKHGRPSIGDISAHSSVHSSVSYGSSSDVKEKNEENLMKCISIPLLRKLMSDEKLCREGGKELISKLLSYIKLHHPKSLRKMIMNGILNSFSKTSTAHVETADTSQDDPDKDEHRSTFGSGSIRKAPSAMNETITKVQQRIRSATTCDISPPASSRNGVNKKGKRPMLSRAKGMSIDNIKDIVTDSMAGASDTQHPPLTRATKSPNVLSSLKSNGSNKFRFFSRNTKRSKFGSVIYSPVGNDSNSPLLTEGRFKKTVPVNLESLNEGIQQFRFITYFISPGHVPEIALIGAMLDLKAPVVSRASFLLECCYLVHRYNTKDSKQATHAEYSLMKDAAMMFYKWGIVVGAKLEELIEKDSRRNNEDDLNGRRTGQIEKNVLNEGDLESVSNECTYGLKLLACQLLLEITAFLRDNYLDFLTHRERSLTNSSNVKVEQRKVSSVSLYRVKKGASSKSHAMPIIAVHDETDLTVASKRKISNALQGVATSPKYQRKLSCKSSKAYFLQSARPSSARQHRDNFHITSSFDEDDEIPTEATTFPWMEGVISFIRSIHNKVTKPNDDVTFVRLQIHWQNLNNGLLALYKPKKEEMNPTTRRSALTTDQISSQDSIQEKEADQVFQYLQMKVAGLQHSPLSVVCKASLVTDKLQLMEIVPCAWHLLLHPDQYLASTAAAIVLVAAAQLGSFVTSFIKKEMTKEDPFVRAKAVLKFGILWKYRYHVWSRLEKNAASTLRIPPPKIEYTLPSPLIGRDPPSTPDSPWNAGASPSVEETDDSDEGQMEWYYDEEKRIEAKAKRRLEKLCKSRKGHPLRTVPISKDADTLPRKRSEDNEEEDAWLTHPLLDNEEEEIELFPPALCAVVLDLIRLLDDTALDSSGQSIANLVNKIIWQCLVDDSDLFFRKIYENITQTDKQEEVLLILRKLGRRMPVLPPVAGTLLFNNLVGVIMYYNRTNKPGCQERTSAVLNVLWQVVPSVSDLFLKDMKQTLRKEYCDSVFMITANFPGVKELRVMYQKQVQKFEIKESTTFENLVSDCQKTFDITDKSLVLHEKHSGALMEKNRLIRDHFIYKRGYPIPLLKLDRMENYKCFKQRQHQALIMKMAEISRLNLSGSIFDAFPSHKHVIFLYTELFKQSAFPRKAIECEFDLCHGRGLAKELFGLDAILKDTWVKFTCTLLENLNEATTTAEESEMFFNVLNGALLLLSDDVVLLRTCLAGFINLSRHFGKIFSVNGYHFILPTILRVYSQHQENCLVVNAIEFAFGQFLVLHQSPFILQLFASAAPILQSDVTSVLDKPNPIEQIPSKVFFNLLQSLDRKTEDQLDILSLIHGDKPIKPFDPACKIDNVEFSMIDIGIRLAVTVISCRPESLRSIQMLVVLSSIVPHYYAHLQQQTDQAISNDNNNDNQEIYSKELKQLRMLLNYVKVIIDNSKCFCSTFREEFHELIDSDPNYDIESSTSKPGFISWTWCTELFGNIRSWFGFGSDRRALNDESDRVSVTGDEQPISYEERCMLTNFYLPRVSLLHLVSDFVTNCGARATEIRDNLKRRLQFPDVMIDGSQATILTGVMCSLLSLEPKNHEILSNIGLQRFMLDALSSIKWTGEKEACFRQIIEKLNHILQKVISRPESHDLVNWSALEIYLRGINLTIWKQRELSNIPQLKKLIDYCIQVILSERFNDEYNPQNMSFATMAAKLATRLIQVNPKVFSLKSVCGDYYLDGNVDRIERFMLDWLLPLCIRLGTGRYDYPQLSQSDMQFTLFMILSFLSPMSSSIGMRQKEDSTTSLELEHDMTYTNVRGRRNSQSIVITSNMYKILFLGLKILIVAFQDRFGPHWKSTAEVMEKLLEYDRSEESIWDFFHFIVDHRSPLLVYILPLVAEKVTEEESLSDGIRSHKTRIERDLWRPCSCPCKGHVLKQLLDELIGMTQNQTDQSATMPLSSPPRGRRRSYSTHNDRSMLLVQLDQQWKNYDRDVEPNDDDIIDGHSKAKMQRKRSSKRVKIAAEPVILDETSQIPKRNADSPEQTFRRKPVLKRQSAEEENLEVRSSDTDEILDKAILDESEQNSSSANVEDEDRKTATLPMVNRTFDRQRYNLIRKREESKSSRTRKKEKWRRLSNSRYRQKMQSQKSFDEEEERHAIDLESDETFTAGGDVDDEKAVSYEKEDNSNYKMIYVDHPALSPSCSSDTPLIDEAVHTSTADHSVEYDRFKSTNTMEVDAPSVSVAESNKPNISTDSADVRNGENVNFKHVVYI